MAVRPNTLRAHRLLYRAQQDGADASALKERLMVGHFQRGENVGDMGTLVRIAAEMGQDAEATREYLSSDADVDTVRGLADRAHQMGINGVPFFIINQAVGMSGAQPPQNLLLAIQQASQPLPQAG
jgi:predicted DsbA family dithiol-disulfide isomerase